METSLEASREAVESLPVSVEDEPARQSVHRELGYGSFTEYVERLFGYAPRVTHDKLRVAEALERLPELSRELGAGKLSFSHARELTWVVTPETERTWLQSAQGRTVREVEKAVSGRRPGALPDSPPEPEVQRHVLRFEVSGETLASFREAVAQLRRVPRRWRPCKRRPFRPFEGLVLGNATRETPWSELLEMWVRRKSSLSRC